MIRLDSHFMGIPISNPLVVSSSGLSNSAKRIIALERAGVGAVVLKSLFEEQILGEMHVALNDSDYPEAYDYVKNYVSGERVESYLNLIKESKSSCSIPIIASINCYNDGDWVKFAKEIELAGADGLELNIFLLDGYQFLTPGSYESKYLEIYNKVRASTSIPLSMKIGHHFSNIITLVKQLEQKGLKDLVLFNRFYQPDIDIDKMTLKSGEVFSSSTDLGEVIRWVSLVSNKAPNVRISASTGIHDYDSVIKVLLAGASTAQICSTIYKNGNSIISQINTCLEEWMEIKGFKKIDDFRGLLSAQHSQYASFFERVQFMKYFEKFEK